jgi:exodeoxyribonuclease VII small subunit
VARPDPAFKNGTTIRWLESVDEMEKKGKAQGYGESMERLDAILEDIDQGRMPIDVMAERVLEAAQLLKHCKEILTGTEAKVKDVLDDLEKEFGADEQPF